MMLYLTETALDRLSTGLFGLDEGPDETGSRGGRYSRFACLRRKATDHVPPWGRERFSHRSDCRWPTRSHILLPFFCFFIYFLPKLAILSTAALPWSGHFLFSIIAITFESQFHYSKPSVGYPSSCMKYPYFSYARDVLPRHMNAVFLRRRFRTCIYFTLRHPHLRS